MKRFVTVTALAIAGAIGSASKADAQYIYGYNTFNPYTGSVGTNTGVFTPYASQAGYSYYNPYTGSSGQKYLYQNLYGTTYYQSYGGNPYFGTSYARSYYYPGYYPGVAVTPSVGYHYPYYYRR
jgi:hypothetical protein